MPYKQTTLDILSALSKGRDVHTTSLLYALEDLGISVRKEENRHTIHYNGEEKSFSEDADFVGGDAWARIAESLQGRIAYEKPFSPEGEPVFSAPTMSLDL